MGTYHTPNPFQRGDEVVIPAGTPIRSTHPTRKFVVSKRSQVVSVSHAFDFYIDTSYREEAGRLKFATVSWAGAGGYWRDAQVTPELLAANGKELPELPGQDGMAGSCQLVVIPSFDEGYTDRWAS